MDDLFYKFFKYKILPEYQILWLFWTNHTSQLSVLNISAITTFFYRTPSLTISCYKRQSASPLWILCVSVLRVRIDTDVCCWVFVPVSARHEITVILSVPAWGTFCFSWYHSDSSAARCVTLGADGAFRLHLIAEDTKILTVILNRSHPGLSSCVLVFIIIQPIRVER